MSGCSHPVGKGETRTGLIYFLDEKFEPQLGFEIQLIDGTTRYVIIRKHCITAMKKFESKSLEELRMEYYKINRKPIPVGFFANQSNKPSPFAKSDSLHKGFILKAKQETASSLTFQPPIGADAQLINGTKRFVTTRKQCITAMEKFESKSVEELRMEYYDANKNFAAAFVQTTDINKWASMRSSLFSQAKQESTSSSIGDISKTSLELKESKAKQNWMFNTPSNDKAEVTQDPQHLEPQRITMPNIKPNVTCTVTDSETTSTPNLTSDSMTSKDPSFEIVIASSNIKQRQRSKSFSDTQQGYKAELREKQEPFATKFITSKHSIGKTSYVSHRLYMTHNMFFALFLGLLLSIILNLYFLFRINE